MTVQQQLSIIFTDENNKESICQKQKLLNSP